MNKENRRITAVIMACSVIFGFMFWIFSACLEYLYIREYFNSLLLHYPGSFMDSVFFNISSYSLYNRLLFFFGYIAGGVIVSFYVIRRIEAKNALVQSEKQLKAIIDSAFDAKILVDREGRILKMNDKAAAYLKKGEDELTGSLLYDLLTDGRREKRKEQFENVLNTKMPVQFDEEFDGRFYRLIIYPVKDNGGDVSSVAFTLRDITQERKIEEEIKFTKDYQNLGISSPGWQNVSELISRIEKDANLMNIEITDKTCGLEIYADPMFEKVLFNILDNSSRHGGVKRISTWYELNKKGCTLIIEDDGCGIEEDLKEKIFGRGFGRNTGIGLFLVREILDITGISIRETGIPGQGARFEILIPRAAFRITME